MKSQLKDKTLFFLLGFNKKKFAFNEIFIYDMCIMNT